MKSARLYLKNGNGTSFYDTTFTATVEDLRKILGEPDFQQNDGRDKTNFDWTMVTEDGTVFTVYDWKEYRPLEEDEEVKWHVGGRSGMDTRKALGEIKKALASI